LLFIPLVTRALPVGGGAAMTLKRAFLAALFTGTAGVLVLIGLQLSRVLCCVTVFYYAALDPSAPFGPSLIGFVFGVGACEEVIKCLPILWRLWRGTLLNWREACLIGMASGAGFGISEAVLYGGHYNGVEGYETYLVRFLSAITLHIMLSGACAILIQRKQEHLVVDVDPINWILTLLAIIIVPVFLHGLFNAFAKHEMIAGCLAVAVGSFIWLAMLIRSSRRREALIAATIDEGPKVIRTERGTRWVAPPEQKKTRRPRR
jgi:RsiW-degrading membrane proteinase PrsW (M82 family)